MAKTAIFLLIFIVSAVVAVLYIYFSGKPFEISPNHFLIVSVEKKSIEDICFADEKDRFLVCPNGNFLEDGKFYSKTGYFLYSESAKDGFYESVMGFINRVVRDKSMGCSEKDAVPYCS